ncbi:MAG: PorV/PorQ family protein [Bacteroidota bacterium]
MTRTILFSALLALAALPVQAQDKVGTTAAPFLGLGVGARATAMGGAQVAQAQGPSALYWNPSAITAMTANGAEFSNSEWFVDSRHQHAAIVFNAGSLGHFGIQVIALDYGDEPVTVIQQCDRDNPVCETGELWDALDLAVGVSYARALTDRFSVGGTAKFVRQQIWNESANGLALDLGVLYDTRFQGIRIGMSMTNFGTDMRLAGPDLRRAVDIEPEENGNNPRNAANLEVDEWAMPLIFRVGVSVVPFQTADQRVTVAADGNAPSDAGQSANFGAEYAWRDLLFVRGGWRQAFGPAEDGGWTAGFGLRYALTRRLAGYFDYVFQNYEPFGTPQMFTVGVTF